jgi:hypothetical protein
MNTIRRVTLGITAVAAALSLAGCGGTAAAAPPMTTPVIGRAITLRTSAGAEISVTPVKVLSSTQPDSMTNPAEPGTRYAAVLFQLVNVGAVTYPIDLPVTSVLDIDGQDYGRAYAFSNAGEILSSDDLPPGARTRGYVTYIVPTGAVLARVQFSTDTATATWEIK